MFVPSSCQRFVFINFALYSFFFVIMVVEVNNGLEKKMGNFRVLLRKYTGTDLNRMTIVCS
jgi:hypothetical protein